MTCLGVLRYIVSGPSGSPFSKHPHGFMHTHSEKVGSTTWEAEEEEEEGERASGKQCDDVIVSVVPETLKRRALTLYSPISLFFFLLLL